MKKYSFNNGDIALLRTNADAPEIGGIGVLSEGERSSLLFESQKTIN